jgi:hypothetical protein
LNSAANTCVATVLDTGVIGKATHDHAIHIYAIAEAFPTSFLGLLIDDHENVVERGAKSDRFYNHLAGSGRLNTLLNDLLPGRVLATAFDSVLNHDDRAAIICGLTALCVAAGEYTTVGDEDGWIILPPPSLVRRWVWEKLTETQNQMVGLNGEGIIHMGLFLFNRTCRDSKRTNF